MQKLNKEKDMLKKKKDEEEKKNNQAEKADRKDFVKVF